MGPSRSLLQAGPVPWPSLPFSTWTLSTESQLFHQGRLPALGLLARVPFWIPVRTAPKGHTPSQESDVHPPTRRHEPRSAHSRDVLGLYLVPNCPPAQEGSTGDAPMRGPSRETGHSRTARARVSFCDHRRSCDLSHWLHISQLAFHCRGAASPRTHSFGERSGLHGVPRIQIQPRTSRCPHAEAVFADATREGPGTKSPRIQSGPKPRGGGPDAKTDRPARAQGRGGRVRRTRQRTDAARHGTPEDTRGFSGDARRGTDRRHPDFPHGPCTFCALKVTGSVGLWPAARGDEQGHPVPRGPVTGVSRGCSSAPRGTLGRPRLGAERAPDPTPRAPASG